MFSKCRPMVDAVEVLRFRTCSCRAFLAGLLVAPLLTACPGPMVVVDGVDSTLPAVRIGSVNLAPDLTVDSASGSGAWQGSTPAPGVSEFALSATAHDPQSGIASVSLAGEVRVWCGSDAGAVAGLTRVSEPLSARNTQSPSDGKLPSELTVFTTVQMGHIRALCPQGLRLVDYQADVQAQATNGASGTTTGLAASVINGPTTLRVAVLNAFAPCLRELENLLGDEVSYRVVCEHLKVVPGEGVILTGGNRRMRRDDVLDRWGDFFATQDIVLLNEIAQGDVRWLDRIRTRMPGFGAAHRGMTVILSRWPVRDLREDSITYSYANPGGLPFNVSSEHVRATLDAPGRPLVVYSVHWAHRPSSPDTASERVRFAERTALDLGTLDPRTPVILGGDFNTKSNFMGLNGGDLESDGVRDEHSRFLALYRGASMPEVARIEAVLTDARAEMVQSGRTVNYVHGYGWPIDRLYVGGGQYVATVYNNTRGDIATPSDHPMLLFTLSRVKGPTP